MKVKSQFDIHTRGLEGQKKKDFEAKQWTLAKLRGLENLRDTVFQLKCEFAWLNVNDQKKIKRVAESELQKLHRG